MVKTAFTTHARVMFFSTLAAAIHATAFYGYSHPVPLSGAADIQTPDPLTISFVLQRASTVQETSHLEEPLQTSHIDHPEPVSKPRQADETVANQERPIKQEKQKQVRKQNDIETARQPAEPVIQTPESINQPIIVVEDALADRKQQDLFLNELLSQIEKNKFYPKKAKRRNIQGTVRVELKLDDTGNIVSLQLFEGHKILQEAATTAIQATAPFSAPPSSLAAPSTIRFGVHYQFR